MNREFKRLVDQLPGLLKKLNKSRLMRRNDLTGIPAKGIYVFFERGKPIYVGRSNRLKKRITAHSRRTSGHNKATFAFLIAKNSARRAGIDLKAYRGDLQEKPAFARLYTKAKERVGKMSVRVIEIDDPILQTLFEVYATVALGTQKYNDFDTH
jgi:hypothetical protein